jgi:hypothetical protein
MPIPDDDAGTRVRMLPACFVASSFYLFFSCSVVCLPVQQLELPAARGPRFALRAREQDDRDGPCARQRGLGGPRVARGARVARALDGVAQGGARGVRARWRGRGRHVMSVIRHAR